MPRINKWIIKLAPCTPLGEVYINDIVIHLRDFMCAYFGIFSRRSESICTWIFSALLIIEKTLRCLSV